MKAATASVPQRHRRTHYPRCSSGQTLNDQRRGMTSMGQCGFPSHDSRYGYNPEASFGQGQRVLPLQQQREYSLRGIGQGLSALSFRTGLSGRSHCCMCTMLFLPFPRWQERAGVCPCLQSRWKTFTEWWVV